jgi:hypothetical protein
VSFLLISCSIADEEVDVYPYYLKGVSTIDQDHAMKIIANYRPKGDVQKFVKIDELSERESQFVDFYFDHQCNLKEHEDFLNQPNLKVYVDYKQASCCDSVIFFKQVYIVDSNSIHFLDKYVNDVHVDIPFW